MIGRNFKKTRIKGVPVKVQLNAFDSITGSIPPLTRNASDNRSGKYNVYFDDTKSVIFYTGSQIIVHGLGLPSGSSLTTTSTPTVTSVAEQYSNIVTTGSIIVNNADSTIIDPSIIHSYVPQELTPFNDFGLPAVEGLSFVTGTQPYSFYSSGSLITDVGEGFTNPVWSKDKLEFDLTPSLVHSFSLTNLTSLSDNFPMAYWNSATRKFEGIGSGTQWKNYTAVTLTQLQQLFWDQPIGFGSTLDPNGTYNSYDNSSYLLGRPITNYGFPVHPKFAGTSSNFIPLSGVINEPFLLEKVVLYVSSALALNHGPAMPSTSMTTFFILNKRRPYAVDSGSITQTITCYSASTTPLTIVTGVSIPTIYNGNYVDSVSDLVTYMQISQIPSLGPPSLAFISGTAREWNTLTTAFNQQFIISGNIKSPSVYQGWTMAADQAALTSKVTSEYIEQWAFNGRKGIFEANGRDWVSPIPGIAFAGTGSISGTWAPASYTQNFNVTASLTRNSPYLLLPTDNLIFGWQLPIPMYSLNDLGSGAHIINGQGPSLTFSTSGINKIVFYGSSIKEFKEKHDTLNQELCSPGIHEAIE